MNKKSLLVIDDDAFVRDIIKNALDKDYRIIEASSYSDVVKLHSETIDCLFRRDRLPIPAPSSQPTFTL